MRLENSRKGNHMSNKMKTISKRETVILLGIISVSMVISGIGPYDRVTWYLEVAPVFIGIPLLFFTFKRFPVTPLTYRLLTGLIKIGLKA